MVFQQNGYLGFFQPYSRGLILLTLVTAIGVRAQSTGEKTTSAPVTSAQTNAPPRAAIAVATNTPPATTGKPASNPGTTAAKKAEPELTGTNAPSAFPDVRETSDTGWDSLQRLDRSLEPGAGSRKKVSATDQPTETLRPHGILPDGVIIKAVTMSNPLQLVNPFAPAEYGWGGDTLVPSVGQHTDGIAFLSLRF